MNLPANTRLTYAKLLAERTLEYANLQQELEVLKSKPPPVPAKDQVNRTAKVTASATDLSQQLPDKALRAELLQLQRENKLMTSAWYDLTCRLQSNTVLLARRAEGGKSWLGRMRTAVNNRSGPAGTTTRSSDVSLFSPPPKKIP
jgi:seryl-tRNA(Sec) selenium transferase